MEAVHNLSVSHVLTILLINEDNVVCVLGTHKRKVDLVVDERPVIVEVRVSTRVDLTTSHRCDLSERGDTHRQHPSTSKHTHFLQHFYYYIL